MPEAEAVALWLVSYMGSLSDEPQLRAMASLFSRASPAICTLAAHPDTRRPRGTPDYVTYFLQSLDEGVLQPGPAVDADELKARIREGGTQILLDGLWRKECYGGGDADGDGSGSSGGCRSDGDSSSSSSSSRAAAARRASLAFCILTRLPSPSRCSPRRLQPVARM